MEWAENGILTFDPIPINLLNDRPTDRFNEKYLNDPLNGGFLEIDPLKLLTDTDGRKYFTGDQIRLVDKDKNLLFKASLPSLVFDDGLFGQQGFNLFAPILNILEANTGTSQWLQDYISKTSIDSLLLSELFIGFNPTGGDVSFWNQDFSAPAKAFLSFSGIPSNVPEPLTIYLVTVGLIILVLAKRRLRRIYT